MNLTRPEHGEECRDQGRPTRPRKVIGVPRTVGCEATELAGGCQSMAWRGSALEVGEVEGGMSRGSAEMSQSVPGERKWPGCGGAGEFQGDAAVTEPEEDNELVPVGPPPFYLCGYSK